MEKRIYENRLRIGKEYQPGFSKDIDLLENELSNLKLEHPFNITPKTKFSLLCEKCKLFKRGAHGDSADIEDVEYLYRYSTLNWLASAKNSHWNPDVIPFKEAFEVLREKCEKKSWFPLSKVMTGFLNNNRGFSWWTTENLVDSGSILEKLFSLGLAANWMNNESIIMRCKKNELFSHQLKVPSVIDGFSQIIFMPSNQCKSQKVGKALNLNDLDKFENGFTEVVIRDIPTSIIEIYPIEIPRIEKSDKWLQNDYQLEKSLLRYYEKK